MMTILANDESSVVLPSISQLSSSPRLNNFERLSGDKVGPQSPRPGTFRTIAGRREEAENDVTH